MESRHQTFAAALAHAAEALSLAERKATEDPATAISLASDAIEAIGVVHIPCLTARAHAVLGVCKVLTGDLEGAGASFASALASSCDWCLPAIERLRCYLVQVTEGPHRAVDIAEEALRRSLSLELLEADLCRHTFGVMLHYSGAISEAVREISTVVECLSAKSPYYSAVVQSLYLVMLDSDDPLDVRHAIEQLLESEKKQTGVKNRTAERAKLYWAIGGGLAKLAKLDKSLSDDNRLEILERAAKYLGRAVDSLRLLRLPLEIAACRTDLAAVLALVNPTGLSYALRIKVRDLPAGVALAQAQAFKAARGTLTPQALTKLWLHLRKLRDATVSAGAPAPLVPYAFA